MNDLSIRARTVTHNLLRIVAGALFMEHGAQKLFGLLGGHPVELMSRMGLAGVLEFFGGALIVLGLLTRPVAFIVAGEMAVAYFTAHFPRGFWPIQNRGEPAALYCFIYLFFAAHGAGAFSLDALLRRRRDPDAIDARGEAVMGLPAD
ncbi:MAG TPA: DoxX family protein [Longimicrobiales bacterium]